LNFTHEITPDRQAIITIQVEPEKMRAAMQQAARVLARQTKIPGFRPGKAPYQVIAARVGLENLRSEALEHLGHELYEQAIKDIGLEPIAPGQIEVVEQDPLTFKATVPLTPVVELGDYHSIRIPPEEVQIEASQVDEILEKLRADNAELVPVDRPLAMGDHLVADLRITAGDTIVLDQQGVTFSASEEAVQSIPPGFVDRLVGMQAGETREFDLTYPEDYQDAQLAGKTVHLTVTVHELKERQLPPLDDELAKTVGDYESLEALRNRIRADLLARARHNADDRYTTAVFKAIIDCSTVQFPPLMVEHELDEMLEEQDKSYKSIGLSLEQVLGMEHVTLEKYRADMRPTAEYRVARALVLNKFIEREKITVSAEEAEAANLTHEQLLVQTAVNRLVSIARGEYTAEKTQTETTE